MTDTLPERSALHAETMALLERRPYRLSMRKISEQTGISVHWLNALAQDRMDDPSALRLEKVRDFLSEQEAQAGRDD